MQREKIGEVVHGGWVREACGVMRDRDSGMDGMDRWVEMACVNWVILFYFFFSCCC